MPNSLGLMLVPLLGLLFGSFLNVCITRLPRGENVASPGSHCRACGTAVRWHQNIPLFSFALLRGRCAACGERFSWRYPVVELSLSLLWLGCALRWGLTPVTLAAMVFCFLSLGLLFTDLETMLLPDSLTLGGLVGGLALRYLITAQPRAVAHALAAAALGFAIPWAIGALYKLLRRRDGMGLGDAKLLAMTGAFLGWRGVLLTFALGAVTAALAGAVILARKRRAGLTSELPLGSFLAAAALFTLFYGEPIVRWYAGFFR